MYWLTSGYLMNKCKKRKRSCNFSTSGTDRLSGLPDEILFLILSLLTLKEAASTRVLGRRWRFLWSFSVKSLNFEDEKALYKGFCRRETLEIAKPKYVEWVNYVLQSHQGQEIDCFRICFCLDKSYSHEIHRWIKFAIQKRVEKIELDLSDVGFYSCMKMYSFPGVKKLSSWSNSKPVAGFLPFSFLRSLRLVYVDVTERVVQYLLDSCNSLEELSVVGSTRLDNLTVSGPPKLKYLEVYHCIPLKVFEISADNLVSLVYSGLHIGQKSEAFLKHVPRLTDLSIGGDYCESLIFQTHVHSSYLNQLTKLKLFIPNEVVRNSDNVPLVYPTLYNLKELELMLGCDRDTNPFFCFTALIKASPSLSRFVVQFQYSRHLFKKYTRSERSEEQRVACKHVHKHLKFIDLIGFNGDQLQLELAQHLLDIALALEKMTIDTRKPLALSARCQRLYGKIFIKYPGVKKRARKFCKKNPPFTRFVVL